MTGDAIYGYMTPISFAMEPDEREALARLGCLEAIRSGTTTLVDPFRHVAGYARGMAETGLRLYLADRRGQGFGVHTCQIRLGAGGRGREIVSTVGTRTVSAASP